MKLKIKKLLLYGFVLTLIPVSVGAITLTLNELEELTGQNFGATVLFPHSGGTGTSTTPSYGEVLLGNNLSGYDLVATSSLGISGFTEAEGDAFWLRLDTTNDPLTGNLDWNGTTREFTGDFIKTYAQGTDVLGLTDSSGISIMASSSLIAGSFGRGFHPMAQGYVAYNIVKMLPGDFGALFDVMDGEGRDMIQISTWGGIQLGSDDSDNMGNMGLTFVRPAGSGGNTLVIAGSSGNIQTKGTIGTINDADLLTLADNALTVNGTLSSGAITAVGASITAGTTISAANDITTTAGDINIASGQYLRLTGDGGNTNIRYDTTQNVVIAVEGEDVAYFRGGEADNAEGILTSKHLSVGNNSALQDKTIVNINENITGDFGTGLTQFQGQNTSIQVTPDAGGEATMTQVTGTILGAVVDLTNAVASSSILASTTISFTASNKINGDGNFIDLGFFKDQNIYASSTSGLNDVWCQITAVTATQITCNSFQAIQTESAVAAGQVDIIGGYDIPWGNAVEGGGFAGAAYVPTNLYYDFGSAVGGQFFARGGNTADLAGKIGTLTGATYAIEANNADVHIMKGMDINLTAINNNIVDDIFGVNIAVNASGGFKQLNDLSLIKFESIALADTSKIMGNFKYLDLEAPTVSESASITGLLVGMNIEDLSGLSTNANTGYGIFSNSDSLNRNDKCWFYRDRGHAMCSKTATTLDIWSDGTIELTASTTVMVESGLGATSTTMTSDYSADDEVFIYCDATSGDATTTLPALPANANRVYHIKKIDSTTNICGIETTGSELIDDMEYIEIENQWDSLMLHATSTNWYIH